MARTPPPKQSDKPEEPPPRRGRAAAVARDLGLAGSAAFTRAGFSDPSLVLRWAEIAGPEIARIARPLKFSEGSSGGVLTLLAEPGAALFLGHDSRALAQRINAYLGRNAVARVKFVQGALTRPPATALPPKPGPPQNPTILCISIRGRTASRPRWKAWPDGACPARSVEQNPRLCQNSIRIIGESPLVAQSPYCNRPCRRPGGSRDRLLHAFEPGRGYGHCRRRQKSRIHAGGDAIAPWAIPRRR